MISASRAHTILLPSPTVLFDLVQKSPIHDKRAPVCIYKRFWKPNDCYSHWVVNPLLVINLNSVWYFSDSFDYTCSNRNTLCEGHSFTVWIDYYIIEFLEGGSLQKSKKTVQGSPVNTPFFTLHLLLIVYEEKTKGLNFDDEKIHD